MKLIDVQELRAALPECLRQVETGETLRVVERARVIAELRPVPAPAEIKPDVDSSFAALARRGAVTRAMLPKKGWTWHAQGAGLPEGSGQALVDALRRER